MTKITDTNDLVLSYWPIIGLAEGQETELLTIRVHDTPTLSGRLSCESSTKLIIWGRQIGAAEFTNLGTGGIPLDDLAGPYTEFELKGQALYAVNGVERVALTVSTGQSGPANWIA